MNNIYIDGYLRELDESVQMAEMCMLGIMMNLVDINIDYSKKKSYSWIRIDRTSKAITFILIEDFEIKVTNDNIGGLPKLYKFMYENLKKSNEIIYEDTIKKLALTYIQTIGLF